MEKHASNFKTFIKCRMFLCEELSPLAQRQQMHNGKQSRFVRIRTRKSEHFSMKMHCTPTPANIRAPCPWNTHIPYYINQSRQTLIEAHHGKENETEHQEMIVAFTQQQQQPRRRKTLFNDFFFSQTFH